MFISWARERRYRYKVISNATINKIFIPLRQICECASIEYGWGSIFNPFFGFKKLREDDTYDDIFPFTIEEQNKIIDTVSNHWKPYFKFAFCSGLRQGEQIALKPDDIDWEKKEIHIYKAITRDENGKIIEGLTKNRYSRRSIKLLPVMEKTLLDQKEIYDKFKGEYFFCNTTGSMIDPSNLRSYIWLPTLKKNGIKVRDMKQTRHTFATIALSCGENPLWIAKVMGHRNTEMIINVYSKYVERVNGSTDGISLNNVYMVNTVKQE